MSTIFVPYWGGVSDFALSDLYYGVSMRHSTPVTGTGSLLDLSAQSARQFTNYNSVGYNTSVTKFGASRLFNASNQCLANLQRSIEGSYNIATGVARTYDIWFYPTSISAVKNNTLWSIRDTNFSYNSAGQIAVYCYVNANGKLKFLVTDSIQLVGSSGGAWNPELTSTTTVTTGAWHHARITISAGGAVKMYLDGVLEASGTMPSSPPAVGSRYYLTLGDIGNLSVAPFAGYLEGFAILTGDKAPTTLPTNIYNEVFKEKWDTISGGTVSSSDTVAGQTTPTTELRAIGRGVIPHTGKYYGEMEVGDTVSMLIAAGIVTASGKFAAARSNATTAFVSAGITAATQSSFTAGRLMFAFDWPNKQMWVGRNGTWFASGDPAAGTNPYYSNLPAEDWFLFTHHDNDGSGTGATTLKLRSAVLGYSAPSGFSLLV